MTTEAELEAWRAWARLQARRTPAARDDDQLRVDVFNALVTLREREQLEVLGGPDDVDPPPRTESDRIDAIERLQGQLADLRGEVQRHEAENDSLQRENAGLRRNVEDLDREQEQRLTEALALRAENAELRDELEAAEAREAELRGLVEQAGDFVAAAADEAEDDDQAGRMPRVAPLERALKGIGKLLGAYLRDHPVALPKETT